MDIKEILDKIADALKHTTYTDDGSFDDEKKPRVIIPKTEQETRDDYLKTYTSLFETYKFPDIEEVLENQDEKVKEIFKHLSTYIQNSDNKIVGSNGQVYTKTSIAIAAQSLLPQLFKLNQLGLANISIDETEKEDFKKVAEYFLHINDLVSKSTGVYSLQDAKDFVEVMNDLIKKIESVFAEANFGDTYTIDYSNFIYNLNACRTNIQSLYEKAYAEAESSIRFNDPNDSVENHLNEVSLTETDSSSVFNHINTFVSQYETKYSDFSRLSTVLKSRELLSKEDISAYLLEFGNISINGEDFSKGIILSGTIFSMVSKFSSIMKEMKTFKNSTGKYSYSNIDLEAFNILKTVLEKTTFPETEFIEPLKDLFHTSSSTVIDMPKFILTLRSHLMNNPIFNSILTTKNLSNENFEMLATKENLLTLIGCVCEALNEYYQSSPLSVHTSFKFDISQDYPKEIESVPLAALSNSLNTYTLKIYENSIDKAIERYKDNPIFLFEFIVTSIIHEFGHYADLVSNLTNSNNQKEKEEKTENVLSNIDFSTLFLLTLVSPSIQEYLNSNEVFKSANEENKFKYIYVLVNDLKNILNYNKYADDKKEMFARYFSYESMDMLLDLLKVTPTVNPKNVEYLKSHLYESSSIISSSKKFQIESNKARELLQNLSEELSSVIDPVYLSRLLTKWSNIPAFNLNFDGLVDPVSISDFDKTSKQLLKDYIASLSPDQVHELAMASIDRNCPELFDFICSHINSLDYDLIKANENSSLIFSKIDELIKMLDDSMALSNQSVSMEDVCRYIYRQVFELNITNSSANKCLSQILNIASEAKKCDAARFDKDFMIRSIYEKLIVSLASLDEELYKDVPAIVQIYNSLNQDVEPIIKLIEERSNFDQNKISVNNIDFINTKIFNYLSDESFKKIFDHFIKTQNINALYLITYNLLYHREDYAEFNNIDVANLDYYAQELMSLPKTKKLSKVYVKIIYSINYQMGNKSELSKIVKQEVDNIRDELEKMHEYIDETFFKPSVPALPEGTQNINE